MLKSIIIIIIIHFLDCNKIIKQLAIDAISTWRYTINFYTEQHCPAG